MPNIESPQWHLVSEHLDRALELAEEERERYVAGLERDSPGVARQVRSLLEGGREAPFQRFLAGAAPPFAAQVSAAAVLLGQRVGPYVIDAEIGHGGMGSVWRAKRADGRFEGRVAIKFIHPSWLGSMGEERFRLEGRLLARLDHRNIARLLDAGMLDGRQPYLVLEYVEGEPIDSYCEQRSLGVQDRITLFLDVLAAVAHAHSHLIVHRDLKPSNIFVTPQGTVKLLDFGIAKLVREDGAEVPLTQSSAHALTPEYAAPEQLLGKPVTTATDVYTLGLVLYVLLTAIHPLRSGARSGLELYRAIVSDDPPRPSAAAIGPLAHRRLLEGDLDNILAKALKKNPADRYASSGAFAEDLQRYLTNQPISARPDTVPYRVAKFVRRHRGGVLVGILITVSLISTSVFALLQTSEARHQRDVARSELRRAEAANDFSSLMLEEVGEGGKLMSREQLLERGVQLLDARYGGDREFVAEMLLQLAGRWGDAERNDMAIALSKRSIEIARQAGNPAVLAMTLCEAARQEAQGEARADVDPWLDEAQRLLARIQDVPLRLDVNCLRARAERATVAGEWDQAAAFFSDAHARQVAEGLQTGLDYTSILNDLGRVYLQQGRYADAYTSIIEVGAAFDRGGRGGTAGRLIIHENVAALLIRMGEPRAALAELEAARHPITGRMSDDELPVGMRAKQAHVLRRLGHVQEARDIIAGAADKLLEADSPRLGSFALVEEAAIRAELNEPERARQLLQRAIEINSRTFRASEDNLALAHGLLANIEVHAGQAEAARSHLEAFLQSAGYQRAHPTVILWPALASAASTLLALGDLAKAEIYADDALVAAEKSARNRNSSADVGEVLMILAQIKVAARRPQDAKPLLDRAVRCFDGGLGSDAPRTEQARNLLLTFPI